MAQSSTSSTTCPTLDALLSQSSQGMERPTICCCGRQECAYLEHNNAAVEGLERDLQSAAQIGQVGVGFLANGRQDSHLMFVVQLCIS